MKPSNPKDSIALNKIPLSLLSPIAKAAWALAQFAGAAKYGAWNWRIAGVRSSVYTDAIGRHLDAYLSGEDRDPVDGSHHLGNIMACCAILIDARAAGKLTDDRPPSVDLRPAYAEVEAQMHVLRDQYAEANPHHYTIAETVQKGRVVEKGNTLVRKVQTVAVRDFDREIATRIKDRGWTHADGTPIAIPEEE